MSILSHDTVIAERNGELIQHWTQQVLHRTHQRISELSIQFHTNAIRIKGIVPSYYIKQLALEGLMMCIATMHLTIHDNIQVRD